jgi:CHAT domain-containing protein/Flp pilus assembly protein TadD
MTRPLKILAVALAFGLAIWIFSELAELFGGPERSGATTPLLAGEAQGAEVDGRLASGEVRRFALAAAAGDLVEAVAEQGGVDFALELRDPQDRRLMRVDSPTGDTGSERLVAVIPATGTYYLELHSLDAAGSAGGFHLRLEPLRRASPENRRRAAAEGLFADLEEQRRSGEVEVTIAGYRSLVPIWLELGHRSDAAKTLYRLGELYRTAGRLDEALAAYEQALELVRDLGPRIEETAILNQLGRIQLERGDALRARELFDPALRVAREAKDVFGEASALNNLGLVEAALGRPGQALELYGQAQRLWRRLGLSGEEAVTLSNIGEAYAMLGELERSRDTLEWALELMRRNGLRQREAVTLSNLGLLLHRAGETERAEAQYTRALELLAETGYAAGEARTLNNFACLRQDRGDLEAARELFLRALTLTHRLGDLRSEAIVLNNLGWLATVGGDAARGVELHRQAFELLESTSAPLPAAAALYGLARAYRGEGRLERALEAIGRALALIEQLRGEVAGLEFRMSFFASRHELYEFQISLLMERYRQNGDPQALRLAFETSERARARGFLDTLTSVTHQPLELAAIQDQLDSETLLLHFELAEPRSFLFLVSTDALRVVELPGEGEIRALAERAYEALAQSDRRLRQEAARLDAGALSEALLGEVVAQLGQRRLVISAEGPLWRIPFGSLPMPAIDGDVRPLLVDHEVVLVPSVSVVAELNQRPSPAPTGALAIIADPVYEASDPRFRGLATKAETGPDEPFRRLEGSARETREILSFLPRDRVFAALGFEASRATVLSGALTDFGVLHFAVHGEVNLPQPELSALVLSRFDSSGQPIAGQLHAYEISDLELSAQLVVLSACESGLGKALEGEGLLGLTRAFFRAGARRVLVSHWQVRDSSTAELMSRFYQQLLEHRLPPAAALRAAQISMLQDPRWNSPSHWAAFTVQGDWR